VDDEWTVVDYDDGGNEVTAGTIAGAEAATGTTDAR
jgi:hypothetical protein